MEDYVGVGIGALQKAYETQIALLGRGVIGEKVNTGVGSDVVLKGDWDSEEAVIKFFREEKFPARVIAEEHGQIDLVENPKYLVILDGVDGSSAMSANSRSRCGTMLEIAANLDPTYNEFIFAGITEYATYRIVYGIKSTLSIHD
jgi:fructose-1,6-bisphosphatase